VPIPPRRRDVSPDDAPPTRATTSAPPSTATSRTVELRVLRADGTPAGGASIRVVELKEWTFGRLRDVASAVAAADGRARISVTPGDGESTSDTSCGFTSSSATRRRTSTSAPRRRDGEAT